MKIKINEHYFYFFNDIAIQLTLDSLASAFSFVARFNPDNESHKTIFRPLSFPKVEIYDDEEKLMLTGVVINSNFVSSSIPELVKISGYSLSGILEDVNIPVSQYPLESLQRSLRDVSNKLLPLFGIGFVVDNSVKNDVDIIYKKTVADPTESVKDYISKLTSQRNIVLSHDEKGNVVYFRPNIKSAPVYFFNSKNVLNMNMNVNGQDLHSEISIIRQSSIEDDSDWFASVEGFISDKKTEGSLKNSFVKIYRPKVSTLSSGTDTDYDTQKAVKNLFASELKNISLKITVNKILNLRPGQIVEVENKDVFLYKRTLFMINEVHIRVKNDASEMSISLVLPETFTGDKPQNIFE